MSLIELTIAVGISLLMILGATTVATSSLLHNLRASSKLDSIQQNSEIKDLIFNGANTTTTCLSRLGMTPSSTTLNMTGETEMANIEHLQSGNSGVRINKVYLTNPFHRRTIGTSHREYSALLKVQHSFSRGLASAPAPVALGILNLTVDSANRITACNWNETAANALQSCTSTHGTSVGTIEGTQTCFTAPQIPIITTCPEGTSLSSGTGRCIPINEFCFSQTLGDDFDGNKFGCETIPAGYAVRYPADFTPPHQPTQTTGDSQPTTQPTQATCACGTGQITSGGSQLCVRAWNNDELLGNYDDMFEVKRCNSVGNLEPNSPNDFVFKEEGNGVSWSFRPGTCVFGSGTKSVNGKLFVTGSCQ